MKFLITRENAKVGMVTTFQPGIFLSICIHSVAYHVNHQDHEEKNPHLPQMKICSIRYLTASLAPAKLCLILSKLDILEFEGGMGGLFSTISPSSNATIQGFLFILFFLVLSFLWTSLPLPLDFSFWQYPSQVWYSTINTGVDFCKLTWYIILYIISLN